MHACVNKILNLKLGRQHQPLWLGHVTINLDYHKIP